MAHAAGFHSFGKRKPCVPACESVKRRRTCPGSWDATRGVGASGLTSADRGAIAHQLRADAQAQLAIVVQREAAKRTTSEQAVQQVYDTFEQQGATETPRLPGVAQNMGAGARLRQYGVAGLALDALFWEPPGTEIARKALAKGLGHGLKSVVFD